MSEEIVGGVRARNLMEVVFHRLVAAVIGVVKKQLKFSLVELVEVDLVVPKVELLDELGWRVVFLYLIADLVVGADGLVGGIPEAEGFLRWFDVKAAPQIACWLNGVVLCNFDTATSLTGCWKPFDLSVR